MIPIIGIIIGSYVFTRMFELLVEKGDGTGSLIQSIKKILAIITMLVTSLGVLGLFFSGS